MAEKKTEVIVWALRERLYSTKERIKIKNVTQECCSSNQGKKESRFTGWCSSSKYTKYAVI